MKEVAMNLLLTLDENYLQPCMVMLDSFFASNPNDTGMTIYLLHSAIPSDKLNELADFYSLFGAELKPIAVDTSPLKTPLPASVIRKRCTIDCSPL